MSEADIWRRTGPYQMTWADFGVLAEGLARQIQADGFAPQVVCGVARGGLVAAAYLASALDIARLHLVRVRRTVDDAVYATKQPAQLHVLTPDGLRDAGAVLIVDDIVGSGATARLVDQHVRAGGVHDVRLAALVRNSRSTYPANYEGMAVDDWVVFPWESGLAAPGRPLRVPGPAPAEGA